MSGVERALAPPLGKRHALRVKKRRGYRSLYCKIDVPWNVAGHRCNLQRVKLGNHDANNGATPIKKKATAMQTQ
jgi:hypothetical protein